MQLTSAIPPASWTIVMASGVVSIDLSADHQPVLSAIMLGFAAAAWLLLAVVLAAPLVYQHGRFAREASSPVSLASVAATAVLGTRLAMQDYRLAAAALLAVAGTGWAVLVVPVLRSWRTPTTGVSFLVGVATDGLALLGATLAVSYRAGWLVGTAVFFLLLAMAFYVFTAVRFDLRQLLSGHGDHWIAGGALAISALTTGKNFEAADALGRFSHQRRALTAGTLVLWCLAMAWLPVLISARSSGPGLATTCAAGQRSSHSACTPRAASPRARSPASPGSPPSARYGRGSHSPPPRWCSPGWSITSVTPGMAGSRPRAQAEVLQLQKGHDDGF